MTINNSKVEDSTEDIGKFKRITERLFISNSIFLTVEILTLITRAKSSEIAGNCDSLFMIFIVKNVFEILRIGYSVFFVTFCFYGSHLRKRQLKKSDRNLYVLFKENQKKVSETVGSEGETSKSGSHSDSDQNL